MGRLIWIEVCFHPVKPRPSKTTGTVGKNLFLPIMNTHRFLLLSFSSLICACLGTHTGQAGTLTGTQATAPSTVNLTAEGMLDWTHWGLNTESDFDQKSPGPNRISNFTPITGDLPNDIFRFDDAGVGYSWSDATPTPSATVSTAGLFIAGLTNGFQFTVAASTNTSILRVYAGAWNAQLHFTASLSDGSAPAYVDESVDDTGAGQAAIYTVTFAADSPGQTLTVRLYSMALNDPDGNCTLMAASLGVPPTGQLSGLGSLLPASAVIDLTKQGALDWAHWGLPAPPASNHKNGVSQQINDFTVTGGGFASQLSASPAAFVWTDGTPAGTSSNTAGIFVAGEGTGFQFAVPADTTPRLLQVYVSAFSARMHFEASLSDNSATAFTDDSFDATQNLQAPLRVYTLSYAAASSGQTLTVKVSVATDEGGGWITLHAATLSLLPAQSGILGGGYTVLATASTVNLTDEGQLDWAHWGLSEPTDVDRKAGATNEISDFGVIGFDTSMLPLEVQQFGDNFTAYSWTDGTPDANAISSGSGIWLAQPGQSAGPGLNSGFEISVPADTTIRTLKVYVGAYTSRMHFEAQLSDEGG